MSICSGVKKNGQPCTRYIRKGTYCHDHKGQGAGAGAGAGSDIVAKHDSYGSAYSKWQSVQAPSFMTDDSGGLWRRCMNWMEEGSECKFILPVSGEASRRDLCNSCHKRIPKPNSKCPNCKKWYSAHTRSFINWCEDCITAGVHAHQRAQLRQYPVPIELVDEKNEQILRPVQTYPCQLCGYNNPYSSEQCELCDSENWNVHADTGELLYDPETAQLLRTAAPLVDHDILSEMQDFVRCLFCGGLREEKENCLRCGEPP